MAGWTRGTTVVLDDEHLVFADLVSPGTVENLSSNPSVEVNVVDPILRKGYRFKGLATVHTSAAEFSRGLVRLVELGSTLTADRVRSIVIIEITDAGSLVSPAYDAGAGEEAVSEHWFEHHASLHRQRQAD